MIARQTGGAWQYYHQDQINSIFAVTNASGTVLERYLYDPFGLPDVRDASWATRTSTTIGNPWMLTGQEWRGDLGLSNYKARWYQPTLGRFLQNDPVRFDAGDINLYRYCGNDPVNRMDPTGSVAVALPAIEAGEAIVLAGLAIVAIAVEKETENARLETEARMELRRRDYEVRAEKNSAAKDEGAPRKETADSVEPSSPGKMQREVDRGQAPRDVKRVDKAHTPTGEPHIHYGDGTASNKSGSTHDQHRGQPNPPRKTREWIEKHRWTPPPKPANDGVKSLPLSK